MLKLTSGILILTLMSPASFASEGEDQANAFIRIYALCLTRLADLPALREQLKVVPKLPPEKAEHFLSGLKGDAWPVPDKSGEFVLTIHEEINFCAVYARRANTEGAIRLFTQLVASPPPPFTSTQMKDEQSHTTTNGKTRTISYKWSIPDTTRGVLLTLSTAPSDTASIQAMGSALFISE